MKTQEIKVGDKVIVFDAQKWSGDISNNSHLWKLATVLKRYRYDTLDHAEWLIDVQFEDGRISKGHFLTGVKI